MVLDTAHPHATTTAPLQGHAGRPHRPGHPAPARRDVPAAAEPALRFRILGAFEAAGDAGAVELPRRQLRWLLASFCLEPGRLLPEYRLIEQVWGTESGSTSALRSSVSRLRAWFAQYGPADAVEITHRGTG